MTRAPRCPEWRRLIRAAKRAPRSERRRAVRKLVAFVTLKLKEARK